MSKRLMVALCAAVSAVAASNGAYAQSTPTGLEEIVVTARRTEERLQSVPIAITAFSQNDVEQKHIQQISDLARSVPSLASNQNQSDANGFYTGQVRLRGLPGTVIYFADVPLGSVDYNPTTGITHGTSTGHFYDLENVQVLKGPQGTLFGKNSIGGLISISPKKPTNDIEGYLQGRLGNYSNREAEGALNVPIVADKLMIRVAGQLQKRDGYTKNITTGGRYDGRNYQAWRVGVLLKPTENLENYLLYDGYHSRTGGSTVIPSFVNPNFTFAQIPLGPGFSLPLTLGNGPSIALLSNPATAGAAVGQAIAAGGFSFFPNITQLLAQQKALGVRAVIGHSLPDIGKDIFQGITNTTRWDINDDLTLKNVAAVRFYKQLHSVDDSGLPIPVLNIGDPTTLKGWNEDANYYTEELQLQGRAFDQKLSWVLGGFLGYDHPVGPTTQASTAVGNPSFYHIDIAHRSKAVFAHGIYDLNDQVPGLRFTAGFRYNWDFTSTQETGFNGVDAIQRDASGRPTNCAPIGYYGNCAAGANGHFKSEGWNLSLDEQLTPDTLVYIRSGNAYRPGATNPQVPAAFQSILPEHVTDVEVGIKTDFTVGTARGRLNLDAFHTWYDKIQVNQLVQVVDDQGNAHAATLQTNAASAKLKGIEAEAVMIPTEWLEIAAQASYLDSKYAKYPTVFAAEEAPPFFYLPRWKYGLTGTLHLPVDKAIGQMSLAVSYTWNGRQYVAPNGGEIYNIIPHFNNMDLRFDWTEIMGHSLDFGIFVTNLRNQTHVQAVIPIYTQLGFTSLTYNEPRMYGASLKLRFGPGTSFTF